MGVKLPGAKTPTEEQAGDSEVQQDAAEETTSATPPPPSKPKKGGSESSAIMKALIKSKGEGVFIQGNKIPVVERIPTGLFEFDYYTGGGFPKGRLSIVYGPESSGKTNISLLAAATAQKFPDDCNKVVFVDLEGTFDPTWAEQFGVDTENLIVVKPGYGEEAVDVIDGLVRADDVALLIVDSIAVVTSAKEAEQSAEKFDVGTAAVLVKRLSNKLAIAFSLEARRGHFPAVIFLNQTRFKIGVMFGDPETMPGGQTMKFLSSLTVRLFGKNKMAKEIHPDKPAFKDTNAVIKKAKVAINGSTFQYDMAMMPTGTLKVGESDSWSTVAGHLREMDLIRKAAKGGGWEVELTDGSVLSYNTLTQIQDHYYTEKSFQKELQSIVVKRKSDNGFLLEAEGYAAK
ncbi:RecA [Stenotrophomonas phage vB_SmaS_DLP_5]|uniref:RecA n=1 Tax=Stenotrophomonas phage vB_SmaS_DLP_5 TaxID=2044561 RepID=A0A2D2W2B6_9CAUD|nr:UvsX-like recombinase [Stenotrophomonas phage vB_SmaS_DLP_5]ATS92285.1 RecA [Stenotrophomonas phage vB_SmaS_DLP_5]